MNTAKSPLPVALLLLLTAAAGCQDAPGPQQQPNGDNAPTADSGGADMATAQDMGGTEDTPTYHGDIRPMMEAHCASCHGPGGIGPFELLDYDSVSTYAEVALQAMESGAMPPWLPDPDCKHYVGERLMPAEDITTFRAWLEAGKPEGQEAEYQAPTLPEPVTLEPTATARMQQPYTPAQELTDDYRCFVLDHEVPEEVYLTGSQVIPGSGAQVHHVLVYALTADKVADLEAADAAEDGPGYTCFGGPLPGGDQTQGGSLPIQLGAWVPGIQPRVLPQGQGTRIPAGSKLVMQIHYNLLTNEPVADSTEFQMVLTTEEPEYLATTRPLPILDLDIQKGDAEAEHVRVFRNFTGKPLTISTLTAHMHLLGRSMKATVLRDGEADDAAGQCLLDIPRWDFNWQQGYRLLDDEWITLQPGDGVRLECVYDNSPQNQPVVDGVQLEPRDVGWGEGTLDEMCLLYVEVITPFTPTRVDAGGCDGGSACIERCEGSDLDCLLGCQELEKDCGQCAVGEVVSCTQSKCGLQLLGARQCLIDCVTNNVILDGNMSLCMQASCPTEYEDLLTCVDPIIDVGTCDAGLASCGLPYGQQ